MNEDDIVNKNLDIHSEWMGYVFKNRDMLERIPKQAVLVILPEDDQELYNENYKILQENKRKAVPVFVVRIGLLWGREGTVTH